MASGATGALPAKKRVKITSNIAAPRKVRSASSLSRLADWSDSEFFLRRKNDDSVVDTYTLLDMLAAEEVQPVYEGTGRKLDKDKSATAYVEKIVADDPKFCVLCNKELDKICQLMYPIAASLIQKPDVCISLEDTSSQLHSLPALLLEVHTLDGEKADSYEHTTLKLFYGLLDQFRLLTNFYEVGSDLQLSGFVFPSPTHTNTKFEGVTKVDIHWEMEEIPGFMVTLKHLPQSEVKKNIQDALLKVSQLTRRSSDPSESEMCYLRLSETHVSMIEYNCSDSVGDRNGLVQVLTRSSILLCNDKVYIKVYPTQKKAHLHILHLKLKNPPIASFPFLIPEIHKEISSIFIFPALPYQPLEIHEAKRCLKELVTKVSSAL